MGLFENWVLRNPLLEYSVLTHIQSLYVIYIYILREREDRCRYRYVHLQEEIHEL